MAKLAKITKGKSSDRTGKSPGVSYKGKNKHRHVSKNTITPMRAKEGMPETQISRRPYSNRFAKRK